MKKNCRIFENLRKTFSIRKKIWLQVLKSGVFATEKVSLIFFLYRNKLQVEKNLPIFENLRKTFLIGKKSDFKFQNGGFLLPKNVLQIGWNFACNRFKISFFFCYQPFCEKLFLSEKNPTSSFKIGGFCEQKMFFKLAEISLIIGLK